MRRLMLTFALIAAAGGLATVAIAQDDYAKTKGWSFANFVTDPLPWETYRDTFIGIPPSRDPWSSAFDVLFFDQLYEHKLGDTGNCFGMSLMSLLMLEKGGHMGFCLPVNQYSGDLSSSIAGPTDMMLTRAINILHGHQVNLPTVQLMLDLAGKHVNRNASYAYDAFQIAHAQNDLTLVSITKDLVPGSHGHTLVAYKAEDLGGGNKRIYVYDPSRPYARVKCQPWYDGGLNYIKITGNAWSFDKTQKEDVNCPVSETWSGNPGSGGNLVITPVSITGPTSRSPASIGDQVIGQILNTLFLTGDSASVEQVTDDRGRRLYVPGTFDVDSNPATGMLSMLPHLPSDQAVESNTPGPTILFQLGRAGGALNVSVHAAESGFTLVANGTRGRITIKSSGGRGTDVISVNQAGTPQASVAIQNRRAATEYQVEFLSVAKPREEFRVLRSSRIAIPEGARARFSLTDRGNALTVDSADQPIRYDLELQNVTRQQTDSLTRRGVVHDAGTRKSVQPSDWSGLRSARVLEELRPVPPAPR